SISLPAPHSTGSPSPAPWPWWVWQCSDWQAGRGGVRASPQHSSSYRKAPSGAFCRSGPLTGHRCRKELKHDHSRHDHANADQCRTIQYLPEEVVSHHRDQGHAGARPDGVHDAHGNGFEGQRKQIKGKRIATDHDYPWPELGETLGQLEG